MLWWLLINVQSDAYTDSEGYQAATGIKYNAYSR